MPVSTFSTAVKGPLHYFQAYSDHFVPLVEAQDVNVPSVRFIAAFLRMFISLSRNTSAYHTEIILHLDSPAKRGQVANLFVVEGE